MGTITRRQISPADAERAAADAFLFGHPLVLMGRLRGNAAANAFVHERMPPDGAHPGGCGAHVEDTLTSSAWLDLGDEPIVLSVPDCHGQYYVGLLIDMWTNAFASIGPRTTGAGAASYAVGGPRWSGGTLPPRLLPITASTSTVRLVMKTQLDRSTGGRSAHALQDGFRIEPLGGWRRPPGRTLEVDPRVAAFATASASEQVEGLDAAAFFAALAVLLEDSPPRRADRELVARLRRCGVLPEAGTGAADDPEIRAARERGMRAALARLRAAGEPSAREAAGRWRIRYAAGPYATDYLRRAAAARTGRFMTSAGDEVSAIVSDDLDGEPLRGARHYLLRFDADESPPVDGFWSLASYEAPTAAGSGSCRSRIGNADGLTTDIDGSLSIHIQPRSPRGREQRSNWLPAPDGDFSLVLRLFWPRGDVLGGRWSPPPVTRVG